MKFVCSRHRGPELARRILDVVIASTGLILLAPLMLVVAIAILLEGGRPLFFSQARIGWKGKAFRMHKFRKFRADIGTDGSPLTAKNDQRMTTVGTFLARSKLDELPQLWNVLRGEMSIVGPRPESLAFADCFSDSYRGLLEHRPGILGPSQVLFRNECEMFPANIDAREFYRAVLFPYKAETDLSYYRTRTILSDLEWIVRGVLAVAGWRPVSMSPVENLVGQASGYPVPPVVSSAP